MARAATTTDAFNAVAEPRRRQILDLLAGGERGIAQLVGNFRGMHGKNEREPVDHRENYLNVAMHRSDPFALRFDASGKPRLDLRKRDGKLAHSTAAAGRELPSSPPKERLAMPNVEVTLAAASFTAPKKEVPIPFSSSSAEEMYAELSDLFARFAR